MHRKPPLAPPILVIPRRQDPTWEVTRGNAPLGGEEFVAEGRIGLLTRVLDLQ